MKKFTMYELISAGLLVIAIAVSGIKMSGRDSLLAFGDRATSTESPVELRIDAQAVIAPETAPATVENSEESAPSEKSTQDQEAVEETEDAIEETTTEETVESEVEETVAEDTVQVMDEAPRESAATAAEEGNQSAAPVETTAQVVVETEPEVVATEATQAPEPAAPSINYPPAGTQEYELFVLINNERAANGLPPYSWSGSLADCAYVRASESVDCFSHTRPDGSDWYTVNPSIMYGENLATGQDNVQWVFNDWMASPEHRANILGPFNTYGSARVGNTWAQEFGY